MAEEKIEKYPHLQFLANNPKIKEEDLPAYLKARMTTFDSSKVKYDKFDGDKDDKKAIEDNLEDLSNSILQDLENEFGYEADFVNIENIAFKHLDITAEYKIAREHLPDDIQTKMRNFDAQYGLVKNTSFNKPEDQQAEITKAHKMSRDLAKDINNHLDKKRQASVEETRMRGKAQKLREQIENLAQEKRFDEAEKVAERHKELTGEDTLIEYVEQARDENFKASQEPSEKQKIEASIDAWYKQEKYYVTKDELMKIGIDIEKAEQKFGFLRWRGKITIGKYVLLEPIATETRYEIELSEADKKKEESEKAQAQE